MGRVYVINRQTPGAVRGNWAVKRNGSIESEGHRTQATAVREAEKLARRHGDTVMIQRPDGRFRKGYSPRKNGRKRKRQQKHRHKKPFGFSKTNASKLLKGNTKIIEDGDLK